MPLVGPEEFRRLPPERQAAILTEMKQTLQLAYDHAVPIVVSPPPGSDRDDLRSASGFFFRIDARLFLGTADHVLKTYITRREGGEDIILQAGSFTVAPDRPGVLRDERADLALIPITDAEAYSSGRHVSTAPRGWPPPLPRVGSYVVFSGCPESLRERDANAHVSFGSFSSIMRVTSATADNVKCEFEREAWVSDSPNLPPALGTDMSGMSGGPVFSLDYSVDVPLIGLIYEFNAGIFGSDIEVLCIRPFSAAQFSPQAGFTRVV